MKKILLIPILILAIAFSASAGTGKFRGKVFNKKNGESLIGAQIVVAGTTNGTVTDFDGNFSLDITEGEHTIIISYVSFEEEKLEISIANGEVKVLNIALEEKTTVLRAATVEARAIQRSEVALIAMKRRSANMIDGISAEQMSLLGDGNAASALTRVTGVSVQGGKYVFVRGLSERYTTITLNQAEIPGLDPQKNTVQMDIFPSNMIENIVIKKTFTPDLPGTSTGGYVDIKTKDFPERFTLQFSNTFEYNMQSSLNRNFISSTPGSLDWIGIDDGSRAIPYNVQQILDGNNTSDGNGPVTNGYIGLDPSAQGIKQANLIANSFSKEFEPTKHMSFLNHSHQFSIGNQHKLFGRTFGYNVGVSYSRNYSYYNNGMIATYETNTPSEKKYVTSENGTMSVKASALANFNYKLNSRNKIGLRYMTTQSGEDIAQYNYGRFPYESYETNIRERQLAFIERRFSAYQLNGKHVIPVLNKAQLTWQASYSRMTQDEPDLRFFTDIERSPGDWEIKSNERPVRYFREMYENNIDNRIDLSIPMKIWGKESKFKMGGFYTFKNRDLSEDKFDHGINKAALHNGIVSDYLDQVITQDRFSSSEFYYYYQIDTKNDLINSYFANQTVTGGYGMLDLSLNKKFRTIFGVRMEYTDMFAANKSDVESEKYREGTIQQLDFLPAANFIYALDDKSNLRAAISRTVARPMFKEIAPFGYFDYQMGMRFNGNPNLERTLINNMDLRYEWYFKPGEIVAVSAFYKHFTNPIERVLDSAAVNEEVLFQNAAQSTLYGIEIELRKSLKFIEVLKDFTLGTNVTLVKSTYQIPEEELKRIHATDPDRPTTRTMVGQSPYIINTYLSYDNKKHGITANVAFNMVGDKLILITTGGTPDIYEKARPSLNMNIGKRFGNNWNMQLSVDNILNAPYATYYNYQNVSGTYYFQNYTKGVVIGFNFSYLIK
jgi:outer membrane receptor protein involved in Fe transport